MPRTVSVVIPCRNEAKYIQACVRSVLNSDYPSNLLDVWVCDGKSDDATPQLVRELAREDQRVHLLINEEQTTPFGLNLGIRKSSGEVVIILGGHAELDARYVAECMAVLEEHPEVGCAGGIIENVYENEVSSIVGTAMSSPFGVGNAHFRTGGASGYVDTVAFGAYRRSVLDEIGLFDESLTRNQDDEMNFRLIKAGHKIYLSPAIKARYFVRASFKKLARQYYQYGYWKVFVNKKHQVVTSVRQLAPPILMLAFTAGFLISLLHPALKLLYVVGASSYVLAALFFAARQSTNPIRMVKVAFTFVLLHFSYGSGYLEGIFRFLVLNKPPRKRSVRLSR